MVAPMSIQPVKKAEFKRDTFIIWHGDHLDMKTLSDVLRRNINTTQIETKKSFPPPGY